MKQMKSTTVYQAYDGTVFLTERECRDYEDMHPNDYIMFSSDGTRTDEPEIASFIYFTNDNACEHFLEDVQDLDIETGDLDSSCCTEGLYYYDDYNRLWTYIDLSLYDALTAIYKIYPDMKNETYHLTYQISKN